MGIGIYELLILLLILGFLVVVPVAIILCVLAFSKQKQSDVSEITALREENARLREENQQLRR